MQWEVWLLNCSPPVPPDPPVFPYPVMRLQVPLALYVPPVPHGCMLVPLEGLAALCVVRKTCLQHDATVCLATACCLRATTYCSHDVCLSAGVIGGTSHSVQFFSTLLLTEEPLLGEGVLRSSSSCSLGGMNTCAAAARDVPPYLWSNKTGQRWPAAPSPTLPHHA
jgi:hypothetical protein